MKGPQKVHGSWNKCIFMEKIIDLKTFLYQIRQINKETEYMNKNQLNITGISRIDHLTSQIHLLLKYT